MFTLHGHAGCQEPQVMPKKRVFFLHRRFGQRFCGDNFPPGFQNEKTSDALRRLWAFGWEASQSWRLFRGESWEVKPIVTSHGWMLVGKEFLTHIYFYIGRQVVWVWLVVTLCFVLHVCGRCFLRRHLIEKFLPDICLLSGWYFCFNRYW